MGRHGKEQAAVVELDKFPEGLRVLAVDDNAVCLRILEKQLRKCKYQPTMVQDPVEALRMLREGGEDQFDLVITDVYMPGIDGFQLLELIGLEMDLPVIMMSVDGEKATVYKGIAHGACDYLVKPVSIKDVTNIWQHVVRKNLNAMDHDSSDSDEAEQRMVQPVEGERGGANGKKVPKKKKNYGDGSDENKESSRIPTTQRKPRVSWTGELHRRFLEIVERLGGANNAYPKTILQLMNVDNLTRASVASHLQKYRIYLKRVNDDPSKANLPFQKWNKSSYTNMNHQRGQPLSDLAFRGSNTMLGAPSVLEPNGVPAQSTNWAMGTVGHGGRTLRNAVPLMPEARKHHASGPPVKPFFPKISDHTKLDGFSSRHADKEYANLLRERLSLDASNVVPSSHPAGNSFANMPNSEPVNKFLVQPPPRDAQLPHHVGNTSNPWQNVASSRFPGTIDGIPLIPSQQVNTPHMNQLPSFGASTGQNQMPVFQNNQMEGIINNKKTAPVPECTEQMAALFSMSSKTAAPVETTSDNFSPMTTHMVNAGSSSNTSSQLLFPNLETATHMANAALLPDTRETSFTLTTQMLNGGTLPMQDEGPVDQQPHDGYQPTYTTSFFLDDILASMPNQDFDDDVFFSGQS